MLIHGADDALREAAVTSLCALCDPQLEKRRVLADQLSRRGGELLDTLAPGGLFGAPSLNLIDGVKATHGKRVESWLVQLRDPGVRPGLVVTLGKADATLEAKAAKIGPSLSISAEPKTSVDAARQIACRAGLAAQIDNLDAAIKRAAANRHADELSNAFALFALSRSDDASIDPADLDAFLDAFGAVDDTALADLITRGDPSAALAHFDAHIRTTEELSSLLARLPFALARKMRGAQDRAAAMLEVQRCERAIRAQSPLARRMAERAVTRLARRRR